MAALKTGERTGSRPQPPEAGARSASLEPGRSLVYFNTVAPRRPGFFAAVTPVKPASQELDASVGASGPHDFAVRINAVRQRRISVHRIPPPTSVTIAKRPSVWDGTAADMKVICANTEAEYFCAKG
jgi:hypothetical protein